MATKGKHFVRTPSGRVVIRVIKKRGYPKCAKCKKPLHGVRLGRGLAKSEKRVNRPFGGYLCSRCAREILKERVRVWSSSQ